MRRPTRPYLAPLLLSLLVAAGLWPAVAWFDFSNESEQLVVAAALESRRDGSAEALWRPTLNGETRLRKPPLATWATMAVISRDEAKRLAAGPVDDAAFAWVTVKVRTVSLLAAAAMLLLTFELGRVLGGRAVGLAALAILAATYGFIEHAVRVTTDLHLALWVLAANVCLARAVLRKTSANPRNPPLSRERSERVVLPLAGVALGLAMMSKGPVCLLETLAPVAAFVVLRRWSVTQRLKRPMTVPRTKPTSKTAILAAVLLFCGVGLLWYGSAYLAHPSVAAEWTTEVSRAGATSVGADKPRDYAVWFALLLPWTIFFVLAAATATCEAWRRLTRGYFGAPPGVGRVRGPGALLALFLTVVPIALLICFPDRKERYLLPMLPPAAVLTAFGAVWVYRDARARPTGARVVIGLHLLTVAVVTLGVPAAAMLLARDPRAGDQRPWLSPAVAVPLQVLAVAVVVGAIVAARRWKLGGLVGGTAVALIFTADVFFAGYGRFHNGQSEMRPLAAAVRAELPAFDAIYTGRRPPPDLSLYAGRPLVRVEAAAAIRSGRPTIWITDRRRGAVDPPLPPGARVLGAAWRGDALWTAVELPPAAGASPASQNAAGD